MGNKTRSALLAIRQICRRLMRRDAWWQQEPNPQQRRTSPEGAREGQDFYRAVVERADDGIAILQDQVVRFANAAVSRITGYSFDELSRVPFVEMLHPDEREKLLDRYDRRMSGEAVPPVYQTIVRHKDGHDVWVEINAGVVRYRGRPANLALVRDITERRHLEESLRSLSEKMQQLHETARRLAGCNAEDEIYQIAAEATERTLAFAACTVDAVEDDQLVVKATSSVVAPGMSRSSPLAAGGIASETHRTGKTFLFGSLQEASGAMPVDPQYRSGISVAIGDVAVLQVVSTENDAFTHDDARLLEILCSHAASAIGRIRLQDELERQAFRDSLTDTYNRRFFTQMIKQELVRSQRYRHPLSVLMIDVNRFKEINDRLGHQLGDLILQAVASLLKSAVRAADIVVRYGGDEFLVLQPETNVDCTESVDRIQQAVDEWNADSSLIDFPLSLAIGVACWQPSDGKSFGAVLKEADQRMYESKQRYGG